MMLTKSLQMSGDFRFDVLKCIYAAKPKWVDLTPMIQACMNAEGSSHKFYLDLLVEMQKKSFIYLNDYELVRFEQAPYIGAFADFPLRAKIKPEGIDEYRRVRIEKSNTKSLWKLIIPWIIAILTLLFNVAVKYHWFGL